MSLNISKIASLHKILNIMRQVLSSLLVIAGLVSGRQSPRLNPPRMLISVTAVLSLRQRASQHL